MKYCYFVWDGYELTVPEPAGTPREDQLTGSNLDNLCELSGRICYDSLGKGRNSVDYHAHIIDVGHGCYDIETEVLTSNGWKSWTNVNEHDFFATRCLDGKIEYHKPIKLIKFRHSGKMYRVAGRGVDLLVTPNHNMYVCPTATKTGRKKTQFNFIKAEALDSISHAYCKDGIWEPDNSHWSMDQHGLNYDSAALLGFAIGDGHIAHNSNQIKFKLRRNRKIQYLNKIIDRLELKKTVNKDTTTVSIPFGLEPLFHKIYNKNKEKQIPVFEDLGINLVACSTSTILTGLFEGLMNSDGHMGRTNNSFDTTSEILAGQFQQLCLHIGLAANVCYITKKLKNNNSSYGKKNIIRLSVISRELRPEVNKFKGTKRKSEWIDNWNGDVFCAEVPNNTLYVKRNGKPVWCGNSVQEHANLTFLIPNLNALDYLSCCECLINRPGIFARKAIKKPLILTQGQPQTLFDLYITLNIRSIREWFKIPLMNAYGELLGKTIVNLAKTKAPLMLNDLPVYDVGSSDCKIVEPEMDEETWVSLFLTNVSRGFSHELVRHKYKTAVSQRSTRYVDEDTSPWCYHPLFVEYYNTIKDSDANDLAKTVEHDAKQAYSVYTKELQRFLIEKGVDKFTARKQARGAARGLLGNALMTELVFSASIDQWKWMLSLRANRHADAEIRLVFNEVFELLSSRFPEKFVGWTKNDCPDGIGYELIKP